MAQQSETAIAKRVWLGQAMPFRQPRGKSVSRSGRMGPLIVLCARVSPERYARLIPTRRRKLPWMLCLVPFFRLACGGDAEPLPLTQALEPARLESSGAVIGEIFI